MTKTLKVEGMTCPHCEKHVAKALEAIDGVASATADHTTDTVVVNLDKDVAEAEFKAAVEGADYTYAGIQ